LLGGQTAGDKKQQKSSQRQRFSSDHRFSSY
jgi:hypothetical protein